jgi:hypothetical protein
VTDLQDRQDFTERPLLQDAAKLSAPGPAPSEPRVPTPPPHDPPPPHACSGTP